MRDAYNEQPDPLDWVSPDYNTPPAEPRGDQPPPLNDPPTAVGASEDPPPRRFVEPWRRPGWRAEGTLTLTRLATQILDTLDSVGDRIAEGLGLR